MVVLIEFRAEFIHVVNGIPPLLLFEFVVSCSCSSAKLDMLFCVCVCVIYET